MENESKVFLHVRHSIITGVLVIVGHHHVHRTRGYHLLEKIFYLESRINGQLPGKGSVDKENIK
jgi:hypothetical protein